MQLQLPCGCRGLWSLMGHDASREGKSNKYTWLVKEQGRRSMESPSRSCGCARVCLISLQNVLVLIWRLSWVKEAELCTRTGKPSSDGYHVQSREVTGLGGCHREFCVCVCVCKVDEWCQTPDQKDYGSPSYKGTERGREFQVEK